VYFVECDAVYVTADVSKEFPTSFSWLAEDPEYGEFKTRNVSREPTMDVFDLRTLYCFVGRRTEKLLHRLRNGGTCLPSGLHPTIGALICRGLSSHDYTQSEMNHNERLFLI
jgi:hypothetical protein